MYIYQNTDKIRFQLDCICIVADKVVQWWAYVTYSYVIPCACLDVHAWMPQEMLRMCNKGLFAGVGLYDLKLHCFYDILRLYSYAWLDHLAIATMSDVQTGFKIRLQCMLANMQQFHC